MNVAQQEVLNLISVITTQIANWHLSNEASLSNLKHNEFNVEATNKPQEYLKSEFQDFDRSEVSCRPRANINPAANYCILITREKLSCQTQIIAMSRKRFSPNHKKN